MDVELTNRGNKNQQARLPNLAIQQIDANRKFQNIRPHVMNGSSCRNNGVDIRSHERNRRRVLNRLGPESQRFFEDERHESASVHGDQLRRHVLVPGARDGESKIDEEGGSDEAAGNLGRRFLGADEDDD